MIINEESIELIEKVQKLLGTDYLRDYKWVVINKSMGYIDNDLFIAVIEDLINEIYHKEEEIETIKDNVKQYYTPKNDYDIYGINENDFH